MGRELSSAAELEGRIAKGWKPNRYLTNMSMAFFEKPQNYVAMRIFPICPVDFSTGYYYKFNKGDLARDYVQRKPRFGKVTPAQFGHTDDTYKCSVDQVIVGIDQIGALDYARARTPESIDPRRAKVRLITDQMLLHMDLTFANNFFHTGVWTNEWTGVASTPIGKQFIKFSDANSDPIGFFDERKREIRLEGRRTPNKLILGYDTFNALKEHPDLLERVKYTGQILYGGFFLRSGCPNMCQCHQCDSRGRLQEQCFLLPSSELCLPFRKKKKQKVRQEQK